MTGGQRGMRHRERVARSAVVKKQGLSAIWFGYRLFFAVVTRLCWCFYHPPRRILAVLSAAYVRCW